MKDFFKPTIAKLLLTFLFPFFFAVEYVVSRTASGTAGDFNLIVQPLPYLIMLIGIIAMSGRTAPLGSTTLQWSDVTIGQKAIGVLFELVLPLAITYLLACGIMFAYKKGRDRVRANVTAEQGR
ncbi:MAG: hypothetical protein PHY34_05420 [Patescibacteria group bacterium]|nr:hypothetical protein [Patescibacteria group bacterium]MDD5715671.1 hypothetical protein [Patescibacteria group bacterium]